MKKRNVKRLPLILTLVTALVALSVMPLFGGCFSTALKSMAFKKPSIELDLAQSYTVTMSDIEFKPAMATNKEFTLNSADENIVKVVGNTMNAVGTGVTEVTATSVDDISVFAVCTVSVGYAVPSELSLTASGARAQYLGKVEPVSFKVGANVELDPKNVYEWSVNGKSAESASGAEFVYLPSDKVGEYVVSVELKEHGLSASEKVRVFTKPIENATASFVGELMQDGDYEPVVFTADWQSDELDPEPFADWYVNDVLYASGRTFKFKPPFAGSYEIRLKVNGVSVPIGENDCAVITAKGSVVPANVAVTYNNIYPDITVSWSCPHTDGMNYRLKIENLTTGKTDTTLSGTNISAAKYFDGTTFAAGTVLDLEKYSYRISVCSLGDDDIYMPSSYSAPVTVERLSPASVKYLNNKVMGGALDYYMVSDEEFAEIMAYHMAFRRSDPSFKFEAYMGYNSSYTAKQLGEMAFDYGATTGSYTTSVTGESRKGGVISVKVNCDNSVVPSKIGGEGSYSGLHALAPHVAERSGRKSDHVFPIEEIETSNSVWSSEELFRTAEFGVRPLPEKGSAAERVYMFARRLLIEIVSDDMTDAEKVHAIYDWIMWNVQYDYEAASSGAAETSALYTAYFLDSVLTNEKPYAVCDGMSKAFSLLCRMEGIEAYRVTGIAGESVSGLSSVAAAQVRSTWGGHAWNKVKVDGQWYVVDATWGDAATTVKSGMFKTITVEMALHSYLLVTDDDIADTHAYDSDVHNPDTARKAYGIYEKITGEYTDGDSSVTVDSYISSSGDAMFEEIDRMMSYLSHMKKTASRTIRINSKEVVRSYVGMEISASDNMMTAFMNAAKASGRSNPFKSALYDLGYGESDLIIKTFSDSIVVMIKM